MKYLYLIERSGAIWELEHTDTKFQQAFQTWQEKGILHVTDLNGNKFGVNTVDVANILDEGSYISWLSSAKPREYVKGGTWFDKQHNRVRVELWKQKQLDETKAIETKKAHDEYEKNKHTYISLERWAELRKEVRTMFPIHKWETTIEDIDKEA